MLVSDSSDDEERSGMEDESPSLRNLNNQFSASRGLERGHLKDSTCHDIPLHFEARLSACIPNYCPVDFKRRDK